MSEVSKSEFVRREERTFTTSFGMDQNDDRPVIRGNPIVFNSPSQVLHLEYNDQVKFRETINPSAVDRTLNSGSKVLAYWNHNGDKVMGSTRNGTLRLQKNDQAMAMALYPTPEFMTTWEAGALRRGDVDRMSFGFRVVVGGDKWSDGPDEFGVWDREIVDMMFSEVSIVGSPAYEETSVSFAKRHEQRVYVPPHLLEKVIGGASVDFLRKVHQNRLA